MVKFVVFPLQFTPLFKYCGVTVIVAIEAAALLALSPTNEAMFPVPAFARPMLGVLFVQVYEFPVPLKVMADVFVLLQITRLLTLFTVGVGLIVIVAFELSPAQVTPALVNDGMIPMVAFIGVLPLFVLKNGAIFPEPEAAKPILVVEFVHA